MRSVSQPNNRYFLATSPQENKPLHRVLSESVSQSRALKPPPQGSETNSGRLGHGKLTAPRRLQCRDPQLLFLQAGELLFPFTRARYYSYMAWNKRMALLNSGMSYQHSWRHNWAQYFRHAKREDLQVQAVFRHKMREMPSYSTCLGRCCLHTPRASQQKVRGLSCSPESSRGSSGDSLALNTTLYCGFVSPDLWV